MNTRTRQQGVTAIGWLIILGLIAFFTLLTLKIVPIYIENYSVKSVLKSLKQEAGITRKTKREILTLVDKRFNINNINRVTYRDVVVEQKGGVLTVIIKYDAKEKIAGNISVLIEFNNSIRIVAN
jgi:hypothetical protein